MQKWKGDVSRVVHAQRCDRLAAVRMIDHAVDGKSVHQEAANEAES